MRTNKPAQTHRPTQVPTFKSVSIGVNTESSIFCVCGFGVKQAVRPRERKNSQRSTLGPAQVSQGPNSKAPLQTSPQKAMNVRNRASVPDASLSTTVSVEGSGIPVEGAQNVGKTTRDAAAAADVARGRLRNATSAKP